MRFLFLPFIFLLSVTTLIAQTAEDELGNWLMVFGTSKFSKTKSIHSEAQMRLYEPGGNFNQLLLRVGLNHHINASTIATVGYAYIPTSSFAKDQTQVITNENRIFQQFILKSQLGRIGFEHRYRLEQRWIRSAGETSYKNRARYRIMMTVPISKPKMEDNTLFLGIYDEIFLNLSNTPFDQNRLYFALGYKFNKSLSIQAGYLRHRAGELDLNRLQLGFFINTDCGCYE